MNISELWNKHIDKTIYILGTGPSVRCFFDLDRILKNQIVIGLNDAFKYYDCTYNMTIHPELIPEQFQFGEWIIKPKGKYWHYNSNDPQFYWFRNNKDVHDFSYVKKTKGYLYVGRGIQTGAMVLAAQMGANLIILIGCDFAQIGPDHHSHETHVEFHELSSHQVYQEYYLNTAILRTKLRDTYKIEVISLQPFLGLGHQEIDYRRICCELDLPCLPSPKDKSTYKREKLDFTS